MNTKNLKNNIWIKGLDIITRSNLIDYSLDKLIYYGNTFDISEELAQRLVTYINSGKMDGYRNYKNPIISDDTYDMVSTAKESIISACENNYCIIFEK